MIERPGTSPTCLGRRDDFALLDGARKALARSQGSIVLIGGEAGIGKSRVLGEFMRASARGRPRNLVQATCTQRAQRPLAPILTFLAAFERVAFAGELARDVRCADERLGAAARGAAGEAVPAVDKATLFAALIAYFKRVATKRATILALEDIQWADPAMLEFLTFLAPRIAGTRLLLVASYRSDHLERNAPLFGALGRTMREPAVRNLILGPLRAPDVGKLITYALAGEHLSEAVRHSIEARCEGIPFFIEELLRDVLKRGPDAAGTWLPDSIRAIVHERLEPFSDDERRVLEQAAVLGYRFDPALLARVTNRSLEELSPALRRARDAHVIVEEEGPLLGCRFRHGLTHQTIYESIPPHRTRRLRDAVRATLAEAASREAAITSHDRGGAAIDVKQTPFAELTARARRAGTVDSRAPKIDVKSQAVTDGETYAEDGRCIVRPASAVLTGRERHVAALAAGGLTNDAIARRLDLSTKTIEKHLSSIFAKLAIRSRAQLAGAIAAQTASLPP